MRLRHAFTMLELVFVIVVMGIIGKFGVEFLAQAYRSFIFSKINHTLQSQSAKTLEIIASRLQYRIKDSVIVRIGAGTTPVPIGSVTNGANYTVLEWVASDIDGFRGETKPYWSGITDLSVSSATALNSPDTNTLDIDKLIKKLSYENSGIDDAALYFIGSNSNVNGYGWDGTAIASQVGAVMHPIKKTAVATDFVPRNAKTGAINTFAGVDVFEYYKLAWTANAIVYTAGKNKKGTLTFYYDYQPWNGENFTKNAQSSIIMENVSTFQFISVGSILKIQVCTKSDLIVEETYSLCKEKTIF